MIKKTITYTDFDGNEITEDYFFHINKAEVLEKEASPDGGYGDILKKIVEEKDVKLMLKAFKMFILDSVGVKSEDGKHFIKSKEYSKEFESSEAYSVLFSELCTNVESAIAFVSGILPLDATQRNDILEKAKNLELPSNT